MARYYENLAYLVDVIYRIGSKNKELKEIFLSAKFRILLQIYRSREISPKELTKLLGFAKSNLSLFCKKLIEEGKIHKEVVALDHRRLKYTLTDKGTRYLRSKLIIFRDLLSSKLNLRKIKILRILVEELLKILAKC